MGMIGILTIRQLKRGRVKQLRVGTTFDAERVEAKVNEAYGHA